MIKVAPLVGKDVTVRAYLARFCRLCHDQLFQVRRVCASSIGDIASIVGPNLTEEVLVIHNVAKSQTKWENMLSHVIPCLNRSVVSGFYARTMYGEFVKHVQNLLRFFRAVVNDYQEAGY